MTKTINSLGIRKDPSMTRVVVAMSGGVDSSVVAAMLKEQDYEVIGVTLQLYDHGAAISKKGACCAGTDIHDARRIAELMDFPHYVLNYENMFKENVIEEFAESYLDGSTPVPCIRCNERVKFKDLLETAKDLGADCMATGHYIQRKLGQHKAELHCAADSSKDQSYFLFTTKQEQLDFLRFPLGHLNSKTATRELARKYNLSVADKPDSQDICFVPNGSYADVIKKLKPEAVEPGYIVDTRGVKLGEHKGIINYTVGQRRGLGIGGGDPLYVLELDAVNRRVIVGEKELLSTKTIKIKDVNWIGDKPFEEIQERKLKVRVRSTSTPVEALVTTEDAKSASVTLNKAEEGIAPGQACVFYERDGTRVLGGGWITKS
ncbi:MAG: tRNA 2-thiouridine(34) synthase MnmA [Paracoccaceae bacterium]|nr:tRNA 2-thiouridine(34) synthase MnmA [Paracoccaceae bacterium]